VEVNERVRILPPTGELLPAEERLQNVLKAIEDRMKEVRAELDEMDQNGWYEGYKEMREFLSGLDIAWSLAKTESLRTDGSGPTVASSSV
jgi:hypothetical protein